MRKIMYFFLLLSSFVAHAAAPLTDLLLAEKFLGNCLANESQKEAFVLGNLFPDICYLTEIPRDSTQEMGIELEEIFLSPSPFVAGMRLHAFIDEMREDLLVKWDIYSWIADFEGKYVTTLLKLVEDEIVFDLLNAEPFSAFLDTILEEEVSTGIPWNTLQKWHGFLKEYINKRPSKILLEHSFKGLPLFNVPAPTIRAWSQLVPWLAKQELLQHYARDLIEQFSFLFHAFDQEKKPLPSSRPVTILQTMETDDCQVSFIEDFKGQKSLVKQIKDPSPNEQFLLVIDALACSIAKEHAIPLNLVTLIPASMPYSGKYFSGRPASLHSIAPGTATSDIFPWKDFTIHQRARKKHSAAWEKWGPLPPKEMGLTRAVIEQISLHKDLPFIAAFDTFTGNADRSNPNIFYDVASDSFCGIDLAAAFTTNLSKPACAQVYCFFHTNGFLSEKETRALWVYHNTLHSLLTNYPAKRLHTLLDTFAKTAGFRPNSPMYSQEVEERIYFHKKMIEENEKYSWQLLRILKHYLESS